MQGEEKREYSGERNQPKGRPRGLCDYSAESGQSDVGLG